MTEHDAWSEYMSNVSRERLQHLLGYHVTGESSIPCEEAVTRCADCGTMLNADPDCLIDNKPYCYACAEKYVGSKVYRLERTATYRETFYIQCVTPEQAIDNIDLSKPTRRKLIEVHEFELFNGEENQPIDIDVTSHLL